MYIGTLPPSVGAITAFPPVASCTTCTSALETGKSMAVREARYPPSSTILAMRACSRRSSMVRSEEHTSELQSQSNLVCRLLLEKKKKQAGDARRKKKICGEQGYA